MPARDAGFGVLGEGYGVQRLQLTSDAVNTFRAGGTVFEIKVLNLGTPVVPFCPFYLGVSLLKLNSRKKGTLIIKGLLGNLVMYCILCTPCRNKAIAEL